MKRFAGSAPPCKLMSRPVARRASAQAQRRTLTPLGSPNSDDEDSLVIQDEVVNVSSRSLQERAADGSTCEGLVGLSRTRRGSEQLQDPRELIAEEVGGVLSVLAPPRINEVDVCLGVLAEEDLTRAPGAC